MQHIDIYKACTLWHRPWLITSCRGIPWQLSHFYSHSTQGVTSGCPQRGERQAEGFASVKYTEAETPQGQAHLVSVQ